MCNRWISIVVIHSPPFDDLKKFITLLLRYAALAPPQIESTEEESKDFAPKMKDMLGDVAGRSVVPAACCPYPDPAEVCFALSAAAQLVRILPGSKGCVMCLFKLCANENSENSSLMAEKKLQLFVFGIKTRRKMVDFQFKIHIKRRACK